jgi:ribonuclease P protein component
MLGVIASRRVGNAVKRNRGKRLVREIFRRNADTLTRGSRFVVVLRSGFDRYDFNDLEKQLNKACAKISAKAEAEGPSK